MNTRRRHTGGPNRTPGKVGLIAGCDYRPCDSCRRRVFVPAESTWTTCRPCRRQTRNWKDAT